MSDNFLIKTSDIPFSSVSPDQKLEQTINRSQKSTNGIIGQTNKKEYVTKWKLNHHELLLIDHFFKKITVVNDDNNELQTHKDFSITIIFKSENLIRILLQNIKNHFNPFSPGSQPLCNIYSNEDRKSVV